MRIFVLTATYELRVSSKSHLRDQPSLRVSPNFDDCGEKSEHSAYSVLAMNMMPR
jgi:hypothetical protein